MNGIPRLKLEKLGIKKSSNTIKARRLQSTKLERGGGGGVKKKFQQHYNEDAEKKQFSRETKLRKLFQKDQKRWTRRLRSVELKDGFAYFRAVESVLKRISPKMKNKNFKNYLARFSEGRTSVGEFKVDLNKVLKDLRCQDVKRRVVVSKREEIKSLSRSEKPETRTPRSKIANSSRIPRSNELMRKRESTTESSVASPRKTATIKWTRRVDVIKILQQKLTTRRELMLRWFRKKNNSLESADAISRNDFARVLEDHLHLHVDPSELKKIWDAAIEHCYAVESNECDVYEFLNAITMLRESRLSSTSSSNVGTYNDDELGLFKNTQRRNDRMNRIHRKHDSLQKCVRPEVAMKMLWSQLTSKQSQIKRIFHDIANERGLLSSENLFDLLKRLNIHVEKTFVSSIWTKRFGCGDKDGIDFHTFRSKLRDLSSSNHDDNFFCGAPSYDRASSKRERFRSLLINANQALEQLRDRVLTQERAVMRVFRGYDVDRCGVLEKEIFRNALGRNFHIKMRDDEFSKLWSRVSSTRNVIPYRAVITRLRRGGTFEPNLSAAPAVESQKQKELTAEEVLSELKSRNLLRSNSIFRSHVEKKTSLRPIDLEQIIHSMDFGNRKLRSRTFRSVWSALDRDGIGKIDIDRLLYFGSNDCSVSVRTTTSG